MKNISSGLKRLLKLKSQFKTFHLKTFSNHMERAMIKAKDICDFAAFVLMMMTFYALYIVLYAVLEG